MQFVQDNTQYLSGCFDTLLGEIIAVFQRNLDPAGQAKTWSDRWAEVQRVLKENKFEPISREVPQAINESLEGIDRVVRIVRAMKEFSHPANDDASEMDLNRAIDASVTISRNRWKHVAEVTLELDPTLPMLVCKATEINQVLLNLIVNAADAVGEKFGYDGENKGQIMVRTRHEDGRIVIEVEDTGCGIPEQNRQRPSRDAGDDRKAELLSCGRPAADSHQEGLAEDGGRLGADVMRVTWFSRRYRSRF